MAVQHPVFTLVFCVGLLGGTFGHMAHADTLPSQPQKPTQAPLKQIPIPSEFAPSQVPGWAPDAYPDLSKMPSVPEDLKTSEDWDVLQAGLESLGQSTLIEAGQFHLDPNLVDTARLWRQESLAQQNRDAARAPVAPETVDIKAILREAHKRRHEP